MGSAQRLKNGNTLIDWGLIFTGLYKTISEVTPDKQTAFELSIPNDAFSYRAHKYELPACKPEAELDKFEMLKGNTYKFIEDEINTGVTIFFEDLDAFIYNTVNVKRIDCAPKYPYFDGEAPVILAKKYWITPQLIYSFKGEVKFDVSFLPPHTDPEKLVVYYRPDLDSGTFQPLETIYDASENQLIATTNQFGEYVIGYQRELVEIDAPKPMFPFDNKIISNNYPVKMVWTSTGRYDNFQLQISTDAEFSNIILDSSNVETPIIVLSELAPNSKYYWRTRTFYRSLISDWSNVRSFNLSAEFIDMLYPNGNEVLTKDSTYIIKWSTNLTDSVAITLLNNGEQLLSINNGFASHSNSFAWKVPKTLEASDLYKIRVTNLKNGNLIAESESNFSISNIVSVQDNTYDTESSLAILPSPVYETAGIEISTKESANIKLAIFDNLGNEVQVIYNSYLEAGTYRVNFDTKKLTAGVYHCLLIDGKKTISKSFVVIK